MIHIFYKQHESILCVWVCVYMYVYVYFPIKTFSAKVFCSMGLPTFIWEEHDGNRGNLDYFTCQAV